MALQRTMDLERHPAGRLQLPIGYGGRASQPGPLWVAKRLSSEGRLAARSGQFFGRKMSDMRRVKSVLSMCLVLSGCVATASNPPWWAPLVTKQPGCSHLSGTYDNAGTRARATSLIGSDSSFFGDTLAGYFVGSGSPSGWHEAKSVMLDTSVPDVLVVVVHYPDRRAARVELKEARGEFSCRGGAIRLAGKRDDLVDPPMAVVSTTHLFQIFKAQDGSLIVAIDDNSAGVVGVFPVGISARSWARFWSRDKASATSVMTA